MTLSGISTRAMGQSSEAESSSRVAFAAVGNRVRANGAVANRVQQKAVGNRVGQSPVKNRVGMNPQAGKRVDLGA